MMSYNNLRLATGNKPIWTIYTPFESPQLKDFKTANFD